MAWGMFLAIPNPLPRWNEKARGQMLTCLPLVGLLVGGLWTLCFWLLSRWTSPAVRLLLAVLPWLLTGFIHLDGYMDVCDAILSRRDLATRQKILKDSHCGAFAVICIVLLALGQWSLFLSAGEGRSLLGLCCIPAAVRCCAGLAVGKLRPMGTSQYAPPEQRPDRCAVPAAGAVHRSAHRHFLQLRAPCRCRRICAGRRLRLSSAGRNVRGYFRLCPDFRGTGGRGRLGLGEVKVWF